jgi:hypothetical protein
MVTDPAGKTVSGLKAADFAVLDKGQPEEIVSFHAYDRSAPGPTLRQKSFWFSICMMPGTRFVSGRTVMIHCAEDGVGAISEARKHTPDLIVLDLELPAGDGFIVLDRLKTNPIIYRPSR